MTYIIQELFSVTVVLLAVQQTTLVTMYFLFYESLFRISLMRQQSRYMTKESLISYTLSNSHALSNICNVFHFTEQLHIQYNILRKVLNGGLTKTMTNVHRKRQNGITEFFYCGTEHCIMGSTFCFYIEIMMSNLQ